MQNLTEKKTRFFKGSGYLIGFFIGTAVAIIFVTITGVEALIGARAGIVSIPLGIGLENKFHGKEREKSPAEKKFLLVSCGLGILLLAVIIALSV
jgi:uncharacterized membrane protein